MDVYLSLSNSNSLQINLHFEVHGIAKTQLLLHNNKIKAKMYEALNLHESVKLCLEM